jgi:hypothetical protein
MNGGPHADCVAEESCVMHVKGQVELVWYRVRCRSARRDGQFCPATQKQHDVIAQKLSRLGKRGGGSLNEE